MQQALQQVNGKTRIFALASEPPGELVNTSGKCEAASGREYPWIHHLTPP